MKNLNQRPTRLTTLAAASALLACALWLTGCSDNSTTPVSGADTAGADLSKIATQLLPEKYQGTSPGARPIWEALEEDQLIVDPLLADLLAEPDSIHDIYSLRIVWGTLNNATDIESPHTNWSGGVGINAAGYMAVRALIDFERGQDELLPRESRTLIRWKSITNQDIDGIQILFFHPKNIDYIVEPDLIFKTEQATIVVPLFDLAKLDTVVRVDKHNAVALQSHIVTANECPHGILAGHWTFKSMTGGHFLGKWIGANGQLMGFLGGEFGESDDGAQVFRGRWVDVEGVFQGHLRGRWGYPETDSGSPALCLSCPDEYGWFAGKFTDSEGHVRGSIRGRFVPPDHDTQLSTRQPGTFFGRWKVDCADNSDG